MVSYKAWTIVLVASTVVMIVGVLGNAGTPTIKSSSATSPKGKAGASRPASSGSTAKAAPAPAQPQPAKWQPNDSPFGVVLDAQTCADDRLPSMLRAAADHGFRMLRTTVSWREVEAHPGNLHFERYDRLVSLARPLGLELMFTLSYCPDWASSLKEDSAEVRARSMPADVKAWGRFVGATVSHFRDNVRYWQIWETPSIRKFRGTARDYLDLLVAAHSAAKQADPHALVFAAEPGGPDLGFIVNLCQPSTVGSFEGISLSPRVETPEHAAVYFHAIKNQILNTATTKAKQLFVSDWGLPVTENGKVRSEADDESLARERLRRAQREQASFAVRAYSVALTSGVDRVFWTRLSDPAPFDPEQGSYQLLDEQLQPRPAAVALRKLFGFLPKKAASDLYSMGNSSARMIAFNGPDQERALIWCAYSSTRLTPPNLPGIEGNGKTRLTSALDADANGSLWERKQAVQLRTEPLLLSDFHLVPSQLQKEQGWFPPPPTRDAVTLDFADEQEKGGLSWRKYQTWNLGSPPLVEQGRARAVRLIPDGPTMSPFVYCDVDDGFIFFNQTDRIEITVRAHAEDPARKAGFNLFYDSPRGHVFSEWMWVEGNRGWKDYTVVLPDAYFANTGGFDFRLSALGSRQDVYVSRITVRRLRTQ